MKWDVIWAKTRASRLGVEEALIRQWVAEGKLGPKDGVRKTGRSNWHRLEAYPPFDALFRPPEIPSASEATDLQSASLPSSSSAGSSTGRGLAEIDESILQDLVPVPEEEPLQPTDPEPPRRQAPETAVLPDAVSMLDPVADDDFDGTADDDEYGEEAEEGTFADEEESPLRQRMARHHEELIDLTPMVDVAFLLLLFFMLTTSYTVQKSIEVAPPERESPGAQAAITLDSLEDDNLIVTIEADDTILVDEIVVPPHRLVEELRSAARQKGTDSMVIRLSEDSHHETLVEVVDAANRLFMARIRWARLGGSEP